MLTVFFTHFVETNEEPGFSINRTLTVNTHSVHEIIKAKIAEIHQNNTILPGKRPSMAILPSESYKITQILWSTFFTYFMIHYSKTLYDVLHIVGNKAKEQISKQVFQESKARQNFRKTDVSYPLMRTRTCTYQEVRIVCFSEILTCFAFLKHPFWDSPFCLITDNMSLY